MPHPRLWRHLSQAKVPILLTILVAALVVFALAAHGRRQCREACLKAGHADYRYARERFGDATCDCITRDGRTVAAPQTTP
ncbi:MAG TPA: hypothetical protein VLD36_02885 [Burkholderiales bacterium]|nr:hypothetical protein [Burkholderiales bacterium]